MCDTSRCTRDVHKEDIAQDRDASKRKADPLVLGGGEGRIGLTMCRLYSRGGLELDFSHLAAYHIASVRLSTKALGTFCGSLPQTNPKKVPLQRTCSCWKVHPEKRDKGPRTLFNMVGRGQEPRSALLQNYGEEHIYPYCSQMAKVELHALG